MIFVEPEVIGAEIIGDDEYDVALCLYTGREAQYE
jgi:hypothetical protein